MQNSCLLSTAYWGPVQYYTKLVAYKAIIERFETYPKQTFRNRMQIYSANGIQSLQVPVIKGSNKNILIKDIKISYAENWQKNHYKSIESAYRSTPFFEYYIDDILPIYSKKYKYLIDLNVDILKATENILDTEFNWSFSNDYEKKPGILDLRDTMHPKNNKNRKDDNFNAVKYLQGFEQRFGFIPNLSVLDLIFNTGSEACIIIKQSIKP